MENYKQQRIKELEEALWTLATRNSQEMHDATHTVGETIRPVHENESVFIPIGSVHRLANKGKIPLELIEVQTGSYLGEDDIERIEDVYKRS
jgi:hypothetical protein